ncbi:hypothetical protein HYALB_00010225 [Hymenoscyphus albidus]|uniref:Fungal lipase-type domain-containing protein n=1 Tax=Hymenoscyphus albidus TaxID=595503 RepID=A0A9N9LR12_9HELO|nr:hypothetical protein HYALB_00010225 [Hymenoscyphus albidus]
MRFVVANVLLLCVSGVFAVPVEVVNVLSGRAVDDALFSQLEFFSQFAAAAYCFDNVNGAGKPLSCKSGGGSCATIEAHKTNITWTFEAGYSNTRGYVAVDDTNKVVVGSFQGTKPGDNNIEDLMTDFDIKGVKTDLCGTANTSDGCLAHQGFYEAAKDASGPVTVAIKEVLEKHPEYRVVMSGHSLGAALAALVGTMMRNEGMVVDIYTYGQPHLGTQDLSLSIQNQAPKLGNNFRVTHFDDAVPKLPPHKFGGWDHYFPEFFIDKNKGTPDASSLRRVDATLFTKDGNEGAGKSKFGALGRLLGGVDAHKLYFGPISKCESSPPGEEREKFF